MINSGSPAATRLACVVLIGAIILILTVASRVGFKAEESAWCDAQTTNCYDRLANKYAPFIATATGEKQ